MNRTTPPDKPANQNNREKGTGFVERSNSRKEDLRVIKTRRNIKEVFLELVKKKPVQKITVTELASLAMINKGTFYLHYTDIYELYREVIVDSMVESFGSLCYYEDFFKAPQRFVRQFLNDFRKQNIKRDFPFFDITTEKLPLPYIMTNIVMEKLMATGLIADSMENRIRLQCCIAAITTSLIHFDEEYLETIITVTGDIIEKTFPSKNYIA